MEKLSIIINKKFTESGLSQTELAKMVGVSRRQINRWLNNYQSNKKIDKDFDKFLTILKIKK